MRRWLDGVAILQRGGGGRAAVDAGRHLSLDYVPFGPGGLEPDTKDWVAIADAVANDSLSVDREVPLVVLTLNARPASAKPGHLIG